MAHSGVSAAAHYELAHSPLEHTVSALLMVWDAGASRLLADGGGELSAAPGSPGSRRAPVPRSTAPAAAAS